VVGEQTEHVDVRPPEVRGDPQRSGHAIHQSWQRQAAPDDRHPLPPEPEGHLGEHVPQTAQRLLGVAPPEVAALDAFREDVAREVEDPVAHVVEVDLGTDRRQRASRRRERNRGPPGTPGRHRGELRHQPGLHELVHEGRHRPSGEVGRRGDVGT